MKLKLYNRDEIFLVNLDTVLYFKAEDHYTSVYYAKDTKQFLPFGLSQLEEAIKNQTNSSESFVRAGRSHLLNFEKVVHVSVSKETVTMYNNVDTFVTVHVSRSVVKDLAKIMKDGESKDKSCRGGEFPKTLYWFRFHILMKHIYNDINQICS